MTFDERTLFWSGAATVVFAVFSALAGLAAWYASDRVSAAKDAEFARFKTDSEARVAEAHARSDEANHAASAANERAAKLELEAAAQRERAARAEEALLELKRAIEPRDFDEAALSKGLRGKPGGVIEIVYKADDGEAFALADKLKRTIGQRPDGGTRGWTIAMVRPISPSDSLTSMPPEAPFHMRAGAWYGLGIAVSALPALSVEGAEFPPLALWRALEQAGLRMPMLSVDDTVADGVIRLVIGQRTG